MEINTNVIKKVIEKNDIFVQFQPIVSVNTRRMVGVEALSRGMFSGEIISPNVLFEYAKDLGLTRELDKLCREKTLAAFSENPIVPMLFLNFEAAILDDVEQGTEMILCTTDKYNTAHENIVIEINEKYVNDNNKTLKFVKEYRKQGFLIALDGVGVGQSNLNRITQVKPDIVKIDMAIVTGIDKSPYMQEIFKSILNLSKKIGALTIAEGAERLEEVITCMQCGVDFFQGFYFAKPQAFEDLFFLELESKLEDVTASLNESIKQKQEIERNYKTSYTSVINDLVNKLSYADINQYEDVMWNFVTDNNKVECVFILDIHGVQLSDTIILEETLNDKHSFLFAPAIKGDRHEIKNYYYAVKEDIENPFISDWYISSATGKTCKTLSSKYLDQNGDTIIACVDMKYDK